MGLIVRWIVGAIAVWLTVELGRRLGLDLEWQGFGAALIFVLVLSIVNAVIRPIVKLFTLPINCLTFGLFALVVNALLFWATAAFTGGLKVGGFLPALFGSVVVAILSGIINSLVKNRFNRSADRDD